MGRNKMKIITNKKHLSKLFEKMATDKILKDMVQTQHLWMSDNRKYDGTTPAYYWLTIRFKAALLEIVKRQIL
jgi:hypothetical protein